MSFHHVAIATNDLEATHRFYTEVMGFDLVKVVVGEVSEGGWAKHVFYDTHDGGMIAFWDIHSDAIPDFDAAISRGLGLPAWTNHIAFDAPTLDDLAARRRHWQDHGQTVVEIDHGWCTSIYIEDPNGTVVEFCTTTAEFSAADRAEAQRLFAAEQPELEQTPDIVFHRPTTADASA